MFNYYYELDKLRIQNKKKNYKYYFITNVANLTFLQKVFIFKILQRAKYLQILFIKLVLNPTFNTPVPEVKCY